MTVSALNPLPRRLPHRASLLKRSILMLIALGSLWVLVAPSMAQDLPGDDGSWSRLDTAHFTFLSQLDESSTRHLAVDLERLRATLEKLTPNGKLTSPSLTNIYLFRDYDDFKPFWLQHQGQPIEGVGHFIAHRHANYAALNADPEVSPQRNLYRQFIHQLLAEQLPQLPMWFRHGLAEYYSTFEADAAGAKIGYPVKLHLSSGTIGGLHIITDDAEAPAPGTLSGISMSEVLKAKTSPGNPYLRPIYLAKAWGLMHYLLHAEERRGQTRDFIRQVVLGSDPDDAFSTAFDVTPQELEDIVFEYRRQQQFQILRLAMPIQSVDEGLWRRVPRHEALFYLGDLILHSSPERHLEAANYFEQSLALARSIGITHGPSHAALGEVAELSGNMEAASRSYALAVEHAGGDALVQFLYGKSLLATLNQRRPADTAGKERLATAVDALVTSTKARPDFAEAWANLGFAYGLRESPSGDEVAALSQAMVLLPARTDIALNLLLAHAKRGERQAADSIFRRLTWMGASEQDRGRAREILLQMDYQEANRLVRKENRLSDAIAMFARIQADSTDAGLRQRAAERIEKFATALHHNRFASLYVEASVRLSDRPGEAPDPQLGAMIDELGELAKPGLQAQAVTDLRLRYQGAQP